MSRHLPSVFTRTRLFPCVPGNVANCYGDIWARFLTDERPFTHGTVWVTVAQAFDAFSYRWRIVKREGSLVQIERIHPRRYRA